MIYDLRLLIDSFYTIDSLHDSTGLPTRRFFLNRNRSGTQITIKSKIAGRFGETFIAVALLSTLLLRPSALLAQGGLTPPGAPAPTFKTLAQIEPRTPISSLPYSITNPGSYYVISNLTGVAGSDGIIIGTNNVTIDLGGFTLFGPGSGSTDDGITLAGGGNPWTNIVIHNGKLSGWSRSGIGGSSFDHCLVEDVIASDNGLSGIAVGNWSIVQRCSARRNGLNSSAQSGIWVGTGTTVSDCTVSEHNGPSSKGIRADAQCVIRNCVVTANNSTNGTGITINSYGMIVNCVVANNRGGTNDHGVFAGAGSQVKNCDVSLNGGDGIVAGDECYITENECVANTGAGIRVTGTGGRIDSNHCTGGQRGFQLIGVDNLVVRNSAQGATVANYDIAAGNHDAGRITSPGASFASTSPWANFSY